MEVKYSNNIECMFLGLDVTKQFVLSSAACSNLAILDDEDFLLIPKENSSFKKVK